MCGFRIVRLEVEDRWNRGKKQWFTNKNRQINLIKPIIASENRLAKWVEIKDWSFISCKRDLICQFIWIK